MDASGDNNEPTEDEDADVVDISSNIWAAVSGRSLKTFVFTDHHSIPGISNMEISSIRPIDLFGLMVTDEVYALIVLQTNLNANQSLSRSTVTRRSRMKKWDDTNVPEIRKFLGLVIYIAIIKYPAISLYWKTNQFYKNNFVPHVMSRNRFQLLLKCIHFAGNATIEGNRLEKVKYLLDILEKNFVSARIPGEILAVDESMIPWRGRLQFRQFNPGKSHKYGVKVYKLCATNGYTYTRSIYAGKFEHT
ncbi:piggyBac transposable element-derived protein 4-like [Eupeodes corollae]|uniref:piggyBac transposable element-derived protein 4-like n=1 Tax=Eupeodes corollae TaxID=290404 RepID=UPI00249296FF|nr:piggyBac transposable element-derived protein 4-like [Eupeodes corollae]